MARVARRLPGLRLLVRSNVTSPGTPPSPLASRAAAVLGAAIALAIVLVPDAGSIGVAPHPWRPAPGTTWQWQITGKVDETVPAQMFDVDLFDARPGEVNAGIVRRLQARGKVVICYLDTGAWESYRPDAARFPRSVIGGPTGWEGERWLDIRRSAWPAFAPIIWARLDLAKRLGCDGVEPDQNNPVGNAPGFPITYADEKAWYLEVARQAHRRGLSVGMKNGIEIIDRELVRAFDWALNEECFQFDECDRLQQFVRAGKAVFQVEYAIPTTRFCAEANRLRFSAMRKRLELGVWRRTCWRQ